MNDDSTAKLMAEFYNNYLTSKSVTPPAAMRAARQAMIADKNYGAPYYWAAFVLVGDWRSGTRAGN